MRFFLASWVFIYKLRFPFVYVCAFYLCPPPLGDAKSSNFTLRMGRCCCCWWWWKQRQPQKQGKPQRQRQPQKTSTTQIQGQHKRQPLGDHKHNLEKTNVFFLVINLDLFFLFFNQSVANFLIFKYSLQIIFIFIFGIKFFYK